MASTLIKGMVAKSVCDPADIIVSSRGKDRLRELHTATGITISSDNRQAIEQSEVILLCVKPADVTQALDNTADAMTGKLLISIVTGLGFSKMEQLSGKNARCIRVMPNTPTMIGAGVSAYAAAQTASKADIEIVRTIFGSMGMIVEVKEEQMNAVTALSGSGPAYIYLMIEALTEAGVSLGLPAKLAQDLAAQTVAGAAQMVIQTGQDPKSLRDMVTSPKGTTAAALAIFEKGEFRDLVNKALQAASARAEELSLK